MKTIGIVTFLAKGLKPWDLDTVRTGITGSEEAVIYVSQKLVQNGYRVIIFAEPPANSIHSREEANPRFISPHRIHSFPLDIAISWRMESIGPILRKLAPKVYLWPEDCLMQRVPPECVFAFHDVLWISEWQRNQWISVDPNFASFTHVFGNAINPEEFLPAKERSNPYSCIYGSNYARGLEILLQIWPIVKHQFPQATLDIYYGWQHWGCLSASKEAWMRKTLPELSDVQDHGLVGHSELNQAYSHAAFWTYPCIVPETFCTTAIRAQMGGAVPVVIEGSALRETVRHGFRCSRPEEYLSLLLRALGRAAEITVAERETMKSFILQKYTWEKIAQGWSALFTNTLRK